MGGMLGEGLGLDVEKGPYVFQHTDSVFLTKIFFCYTIRCMLANFDKYQLNLLKENNV